MYCYSVCYILGGPNKNGTVLEVKGWEGETDVSFLDITVYIFTHILQRSVVEVAWIMNGSTNIYRLGHKGKVGIVFVIVLLLYATSSDAQ